MKVHHRRLLRDRYTQIGYDIDISENLTAYPKKAHAEINVEFEAWARSEIKKSKYLDRNDFKLRVHLADVEKKMDEIMNQDAIKQYAIPIGASKDDINKVRKNLPHIDDLQLTRPSRLEQIGVGIAFLCVFISISENVRAANNIANHSPGALSEWESFSRQYADLFQSSLDEKNVSAEDLRKLTAAGAAYAISLAQKPEDVQKWQALINATIDLGPNRDRKPMT